MKLFCHTVHSCPKAPSDHGFDKALAACDKSLAALGRQSPLDLYLIHWPGAQGRKREDPQNALLRKESWRALEQLYSEGGSGVLLKHCVLVVWCTCALGKVKALGVSNYTVRHLEELLTYATIKPHVLQVILISQNLYAKFNIVIFFFVE